MDQTDLDLLSADVAEILGVPFEWCRVTGGLVTLEDAAEIGGTAGGQYRVLDFALARYPVTNAAYQAYLSDPGGYQNPLWWRYSPQATQYQADRPGANNTAFAGADLPRTRVSWFDGMAFCAWLSGTLADRRGLLFDPCQHDSWLVRLPTEQEWQRAAVGDTGWPYAWGDHLDPTRANYGKQVGHPTPVSQYSAAQSPYGVADLSGNVWEWCLNGWSDNSHDLCGYGHRAMRGGAWNVSLPEHVRAISRNGHPPRGRLNDAGFRCAMPFNVL